MKVADDTLTAEGFGYGIFALREAHPDGD